MLEICAQSERGLAIVRLAAIGSRDPTIATSGGVSLSQSRRVSTTLSAREVEILGMVAQGFRNNDVARMLFISPKTVKSHLQHIFAKLEVSSRTEAAVKAKEAGLLS